MRFRPFVGDYLPAVAVDGFFLATQYDVPWTRPEFGFEGPWDHVQALEFIKAGLEVGIARQEAVWCIHRGPLEEPSDEQRKRRWIALGPQAAALRQLYPAFIGVSAQRLHEQYRKGAKRLDRIEDNVSSGVAGRRTAHDVSSSAVRTRESLGIIIASFNGQPTLLRALRALLLQCATLQGLECRVVVVDNGSNGTAEAVRREFPQVTLIANASDDGAAGRFNLGLRYLNFPDYILVTHGSVELAAETLTGMVSHLREHPSTAGAVASLIDSDGVGRSRGTGVLGLISRRPRRAQQITSVGTACAMVRGEVFFDVGLYDERLSCHEDLDWSLRAKRKGYKFACLPEASVVRDADPSLRQGNPERLVANLWFVYKHSGRRWATVLYSVQWLLARWLAFRWRNDCEAPRQLRRAMAHAESLYRRFREENRPPQLS